MSAAPTGLAWRRVPLLALGALALVAGLWSGLSRLGALVSPVSPLAHGPLMISGFLGTVIALERAVAARVTWALAGPLSCGLGTVLLLAGLPTPGAALLSLGSVVVLTVLAQVAWRAPMLHHGVLVLAAASWLLGNVLLLGGRPVFESVPCWMLFLVGTIAAERLELTRVLPRPPPVVAAFVGALGLITVGVVTSLQAREAGVRVLSLGFITLAAWLLRFDVARRTVRQHDLVRYIAVALLSGYGWLLVAGGLGVAFDLAPAGPRYDALLHAVFVGFVFSMIFGHAPIILPAVLNVKVPFRARFYGHLALLHASVALRLAGDLLDVFALRRLGAWGNALAIVAFIVSTALASILPLPPRGERVGVRGNA